MVAIRVFCMAKLVPTLRDCFTFAAGAGEGVLLAFEAHSIATTQADSPGWREARVVYREDAPAFAVRVLRRTDDDTRLLDTLHRFLAALDGAAQSDAMRGVRYHLSETRYIVEATLPADADADALQSVAWFTRLFVARYEGLLQVDGEGFYASDGDLIFVLDAA